MNEPTTDDGETLDTRSEGEANNQDSQPAKLSLRAYNVLWIAGIEPLKDEVKAAIVSGKLNPSKFRNYGKKTHEELRAWVGLTSA